MKLHLLFQCGFIAVTLVSLASCAAVELTPQMVRASQLSVDRRDGVSSEEAIILAQNHLLRRGDTDRVLSLRPYKIFKEIIWLKEDGEMIKIAGEPSPTFEGNLQTRWIVYFKDRFHSLLWGVIPLKPLFVEVDADSGEVMLSGIRYR